MSVVRSVLATVDVILINILVVGKMPPSWVRIPLVLFLCFFAVRNFMK